MNCAPDLKSPGIFFISRPLRHHPCRNCAHLVFLFCGPAPISYSRLGLLKKKDTWALDDWVLHRSRAWPQPVSRLLFGT